MTIFFNNIKRIFRKKANIIVMFLFPILFISIISSISSGGSGFTVGVVDNDNTKLTSMIKERIKANGTIKIVNKKDISDYIIDKKIDMAIVIPKGLTKNIIGNSKGENIEIYGIKGTSNDSSMEYYVNSFVNAAQNIAKAAKGDKTKFYNGVKNYQKGNFVSETKYTNGEREKQKTSTTSIGFLIASIIYLSTMITTLILVDKKDGVYNRMFASGVNRFRYIVGSMFSFVAVNLIQIAGVFLVMKYVVKIDLGPSPIKLYLVLVVFGIACVSLGVLISNRCKDLKQANSMTVLISTPVAMLGGCYWPKEVMGSTLQRIGDFVPSTWAMNAVDKIINGGSLSSIYKEVGILCIFIVVFLVLAMVKKVDVANN
ncbi:MULTISPECIES: ABC transporter permease [Clostridium]|uniref:Predicted permease n=1 Tax=Clostridium acetobutylicum (strain ATCC 824 / DSM 792 / JCM 1419 / IAM 19013 / LMG 5710 / NBRC 13948 / NRRL B-527 / VKM B-1787 / 2291 / W) TaxID=272562 RepID=Q97MF5_CLOAB|nr:MULTISPECIES: ABC transporter permease [Clostridium]AAK78224.1 Predicted permease [Clostridium acetobutylicum ATCC 824]ADZ19290.1 permease [Clostridium acetobutylicum EA 2018]AEI34648.1 permease [Clostridium acetobutylicum DSM 1731]AWV82032.1 ABC transporter permease [Clostridium acetobutylicum]MBC2396078.1 ABC transporter permease [Clostridium acetobutylicum]